MAVTSEFLILLCTLVVVASPASVLDNYRRIINDCPEVVTRFQTNPRSIYDVKFQEEVSLCKRLLALEALDGTSSSSVISRKPTLSNDVFASGFGSRIFGGGSSVKNFRPQKVNIAGSKGRQPKCSMILYNRQSFKPGKTRRVLWERKGNVRFTVRSIQTFGPCQWRIYSNTNGFNKKCSSYNCVKIEGDSGLTYNSSATFGLATGYVKSFKKLAPPPTK